MVREAGGSDPPVPPHKIKFCLEVKVQNKHFCMQGFLFQMKQQLIKCKQTENF